MLHLSFPPSPQVERRVVNQLAAAYEQQIITRGSLVHLVVETGDKGAPAVRLQVKEEGGVKRTPVGTSQLTYWLG